jgi:DNA polymerase V
MPKIFALIDANNYYVSCERLFSPGLLGRAVVVCGNLDRFGVIVSRSQEAKDLGIEMAQPVFQVKDFLEKHSVVVCSANYSLYMDIHNRMSEVVHRFSSDVYDYSVDEFFLDLSEFKNWDLRAYAAEIRRCVLNVGIPTSIGIGPSKLLSKLASKLAKKEKSGVKVLMDEQEIDEVLKNTKVSHLWGIASRLERRLNVLGVVNAYQLKTYPEDIILKNFGIVMLRMVNELKGFSCIPNDQIVQQKHKQFICSRSFGKYISKLEALKQRVAGFVSSAAERMRQEDLLCSKLQVFIMTNHHNETHDQYRNSVTVNLPSPTCHTSILIHHALVGLQYIFKEGYNFKKAGIMFVELSDSKEYQAALFQTEDKAKTKRLMRAMDLINYKMGKNTLHMLSADHETSNWGVKQVSLSPHYTTRWQDVLRLG